MKFSFHKLLLKWPIWLWTPLLLALFVVGTFCAKQVSLQIDLTSNKRYTLSDSSNRILENLQQPVRIRYYVSESDNVLPIAMRNFAKRVEDLLDVLSNASDGKLKVEKLDPLPDSEAEVAANIDGIYGELVGPDTRAYLGMTINGVEQTRSIPFLNPQDEINLEYEILKSIQQITRESLPKIGIFSTISTFVGREEQGGASALVHLLSDEAKVVQLKGTETSFPSEMEYIVVINPRKMDPSFTKATLEFMAQGKGVCILLDPLTLSELFFGKQPNSGGLNSDWPAMLDALGVNFDNTKSILDMKLKGRINRGQGEEVLNYLLDYEREGLNADHPTTRNSGNIKLVTAGFLEHKKNSPFTVTRLIQSTQDSALHDAKKLAVVTPYDAKQLLNTFKADGSVYDIAYMLEGKVREDAKECHVFIMADADFMTDPFAGTTNKVQERQVFNPTNGSMDFLLNCLDYIGGGSELAEIRNRKHISRPLTRLVDLQRQAEEKYRTQIAELEKQVEDMKAANFAGNAATALAKSGRQLNSKTLSSMQSSKELEKTLNQELHLILRQLRSDVKLIESRVKWFNIAGIPFLIALIGGGIVLRRHAKTSPRRNG